MMDNSFGIQTYSFQRSLPTLPVPPLQETLQKYTTSLRPIFHNDPKQLAKSTRVVEEFEHGIGRILHSKLLDRAQKQSNWLEEWWDRQYLDSRSSIPILSNYFFNFDSCKPGEMSACRRASHLIVKALQFKHLLDREQLPPDMIRNTPLCMDSYPYLFSTCRVPGCQGDAVYQYPSASHIIVMRRNHIFSISLDSPYSESIQEIEKTLEKICLESGNKAIPVGILTAENRGKWFHMREILYEFNSEALECIQSALFVVSLDEDSPKNSEEASKLLFTGNTANRWFDKSIQFVIFENGMAGLIGEHSKLDGLPCAAFTDFILSAKSEYKHWSPRPARGDLLHNRYCFGLKYNKLEFNVPPQVKSAIEESMLDFKQFSSQYDVKLFQFKDFGKDEIKKANISPDAFIQMAMQLSYFEVFNKFAVTYESAQTKRFYHGRTEAGRVLSQDSLLWVQSMTNPEFTSEQRLKHLLKACESHSKNMSNACDGLGVDRLMLGLRSIAKELGYQTLEIFEDSGYINSCKWELSTSQVSSEMFNVGFGPSEATGFGICYSLRNKQIVMNISGKTNKDQIQLFMNCLARNLREMQQLCAKC